MKGDREAIRKRLEYKIKEAERGGLGTMQNCEIVLNYNEAWAALFGLRFYKDHLRKKQLTSQ